MKTRAIRGILTKDLKEFMREKTTVFWVFVFPIMLISVFGLLWGNPSPATVKVGVVGDGSMIVGAMENITLDGEPLFEVTPFTNESKGLDALSHGSVRALLVFPLGFSQNLSKGVPAHLAVYYNKGNPEGYQIARGTIESFFSEFSERIALKRAFTTAGNLSPAERELVYGIAEPISVSTLTVPGRGTNPMEFYVTGFIALQFLFATMNMIGVGTLTEIEKGTIRRIAASPTTPWDFLLGKILSTLTLIIASIVAGITFTYIAFHTLVLPGVLGWVIILLMATFSMGLGLAIAMLTRSIKATNAVVNVVSWPMMFLAGIFVPLSALPNWVRPIIKYYPIGRAVRDLRLLVMYNVPPREVAPDILWLGLASLSTLVVAVISYRWAIQRLSR